MRTDNYEYVPHSAAMELVTQYLESIANGSYGRWASEPDPTTGWDALDEATEDARLMMLDDPFWME